MKNQKYLICLLCILLFSFSCSEDSLPDEFNDANGKIEKKLIESISIVSAQDSRENKNILVSYTTKGLLNTITTGTEASIFIYDKNNNLSNITGGSDNLNIEELYESPYDAFKEGEVIEFDKNGNPKMINFYEEDYDENSNSYLAKIYTAEVSYDDTHNPFFYTLEAGGIIEVLDGVKLNFSMTPQNSKIVKARSLFPVNNPSQIIYKNQEGEIIYTRNANYDYDNDNYPTSATITSVSVKYSKQYIYSVTFKYVD